MSRLSSQPCGAALIGLALTSLLPLAWAGDFSVNPIRVELGVGARSAAITVVNEGKEKLSFQLQGMEWTQDAAGADQYKETPDLVFFPKIMSVEAGQEAVIRLGLKPAAATSERTFRLFIEELPGRVTKPEGNVAQVNVLVRFGVPVFAAPARPQDALGIEGLELNKGQVSFAARNTGNRHHLFKSVKLEGRDAAGRRVYGLQIAERYLLASSVKSFSATLPPEACRQMVRLEVEVQTDKLTETRLLEVSSPMCP